MTPSFTKEQIETFKEKFFFFDINGDGKITMNELRKVMLSLQQNPSDRELKNIIEEVDADKDGALNFEEFLTLMKLKIKEDNSDAEIREAFVIIDSNEDGYITAKELQNFMKGLYETVTKDELREMIAIADKDGDSKISFEEFKSQYLSMSGRS